MADSARATLVQGDVRQALISLALPMTVGIVFIIAVNLVDTYFVGRLGTAELAAMSFTFPVVNLVMSAAMGLSIGVTSAVARALGAGDDDAVRRLTTHAIILATLVVALISVVGVLTQDQVFAMLGAEPELIPLLDDYMTIWYAGAVFLVVPIVGNGVMRAGGDARSPALIMMAAALANLILDPICIFGFGPVPAMGLRGAAIATVIARSFTLLFTLYILAGRMRLIDWSIPGLGPLVKSWKSILSVGLPAVVTNVLAPIAAATMTAIIALQGSAAVAGYGIGGRVEGMLLIAPMALSSALTPFIGQNWGAHHPERVAEALRIANRFVLLWGAGIWIVLSGTGTYIVRAFTEDPEVIDAARTYLWLVPLSYGAHGLVSVASSTFNAIDRAVRSTALSALRSLALAVPLAFLGGKFFGLTGVFVGIAVATAISGVVAALWLRRSADTDVEAVPAARAHEKRAPTVRGGQLRLVGAPVEQAIDELLDRVIELPDITVRARPINTLGFYIGDFELGHVHRNGHLDMRLPPLIHDQVIAEDLAEHHRHHHDTCWLSTQLTQPSDSEGAAWLLQLGQVFGRLYKRGASSEVLAELDQLGPSDALRACVMQAAESCRQRRAAQASESETEVTAPVTSDHGSTTQIADADQNADTDADAATDADADADVAG